MKKTKSFTFLCLQCLFVSRNYSITITTLRYFSASCTRNFSVRQLECDEKKKAFGDRARYAKTSNFVGALPTDFEQRCPDNTHWSARKGAGGETPQNVAHCVLLHAASYIAVGVHDSHLTAVCRWPTSSSRVALFCGYLPVEVS